MRARPAIWAPPVVAGIVGLASWEAVLRVTDPDGFVLPTPTEIVRAFSEDWSGIWQASLTTGYVVVTGMVAGVVAGAVAALVVTRFRTADEALTPLAVAVNAIPIVALAPVFNAWFGITSPRSNQAVVLVLCFFPVFINTSRGLTEVGQDQLELMRSYAAGEWRTTWDVRIPNALPFFFTSLKIVASLAVIAAIVAEYFGGRQDALGPMIVQSAGLTRYDEAWAAVFAGAAIGVGIYVIVTVVERLALPWSTAVRADSR